MLKARVQTELWLEFFFLRPGQGLNPKVHFFSNEGRTKNDANHPKYLNLSFLKSASSQRPQA